MRDPYTVLGVGRTASEKDIKSAYRKLAKAYHPDQNKNDPKAESKFAEISSAYDLLSDTDKRARFDRGEIDGDGNPRFAGFDFNAARSGGRAGAGAGGFNPEDILKEFMSGFGGTRRSSGTAGGTGFAGQGFDPGATAGAGRNTRMGTRGQDLSASIAVSLEEAHTGASVTVRLPNTRTLSVKLPQGVEDGQQIRLKGQGEPSPIGGEPGDALITVRLEKHAKFRRDGLDLRVDVPVTLYEAVLGGKVRVPTLDGAVELTLKPYAETAKAMRLKGKGLHGTGDLYVNLRVVLPEGGDPDLEALMRFWRDNKPYKLRD